METVLWPLELRSLVTAASRFAGHLRGRHGIVVVTPVPLSAIMTALLGRGIAIPGQVEIAAVLTTPESIKVAPIPTHYPFPAAAFVRAVTEIAVHFFETDQVPVIHKTLGLRMIAGD